MESNKSVTISKEDLHQITEMGISIDALEEQLKRFDSGFPFLEISENVEIGNGLIDFGNSDLKHFIDFYESKAAPLRTVKFVPASGAASRMFKSLFNYLGDKLNARDDSISHFFRNLGKFPFYEELAAVLDPSDDIDKLAEVGDKKLLEKLLTAQGLNYGSLPKALLSFHRYSDGTVRKAIDEHMVEGAYLCPYGANRVFIHITISKQHHTLFREHLKQVIPIFQEMLRKDIDVNLSFQDAATNTVAVDVQNRMIRDDRGHMVFRPAGHGALLGNLNNVDADLVFIKNVDNVVPDRLKADTLDYKKAMAGLLLHIQQQTIEFCKKLASQTAGSISFEEDIVHFATENLGFKIPPDFSDWNQKNRRDYLFNKLNRPLRVCGVIRGQGTGGGPYWVRHRDGSGSLQLLETDQINKSDVGQNKFQKDSKYANITDLVCALKNFQGEKFDLNRFRDANAGFISKKSFQGRPIKAMELPGLWNGAMSDWNTLFVNVPESTFTPVKTVLDLLEPEHQ